MGIFSNLQKAANVTLEGYIKKATSALQRKDEYVIEPKSITGLDKYDENEGGYKERASVISFDILRQMAMRNTVVSAIIMTRKNQIASFGRLQPTKYDVGFKCVMRDREAKPTDEDKTNLKMMEAWILTTGGDENRPEETKFSLTEFLAIMSRDLLIYDQIGIETVGANDNTLAYFMPAASGSLRIASKDMNKDSVLGPASRSLQSGLFSGNNPVEREQEIIKEDSKRDDPYAYVQIYEGQIVRGFFSDEMILAMMNKVTDLEANGYSVGPLELLANVVSYHLYAESHNRLFFVQGFASRGILHIEGDIPSHHLEAFRRQWRQQLSGTHNAWRTPILAGGNKINWIPLQATNRDMEWSAWLEYLIKLICALYTIAPQEINFDITKSQGPTLSDSGAKNDSVLSDSKVRGLWPILKFFEAIINDRLIKRYNEEFYKKYEFIFCGLDVESKQKELDRIEKETKTYKTINEARAEHDMKPIEGGDIIRDSTFTSALQNAKADAEIAAQQAEGAGIEGDEPDDTPYELGDQQQDGDNGLSDDEDDFLEGVDKITKAMVRKSRVKAPKLLKVEYWRK